MCNTITFSSIDEIERYYKMTEAMGIVPTVEYYRVDELLCPRGIDVARIEAICKLGYKGGERPWMYLGVQTLVEASYIEEMSDIFVENGIDVYILYPEDRRNIR